MDFTDDLWRSGVMGVYAGPERNVSLQTTSGRSLYSLGVVQDGLVFNLDAGKFYSYPKSGTAWTDLTNNGRNGTLEGGVGYSGLNGGSLVFDGTDDYVETNNTIVSSGSFTLAVWAISSSTKGNANRICGNGDSQNGNSGVDIIWTGNSSLYSVRRGGGSSADISVSGLSSLGGFWNYICVSYTNTTSIGSVLYQNGVSIGTNTTLGYSATLPFRIGRDGNIYDAFDGKVAIVQWYNRGLSASEVLQNFNATRSRFSI